MPKWRLGVALMFREPHRSQIQGIRKALGDGALAMIDPHITVASPVNVNVNDLEDAFRLLRHAAARCEPFSLEVGPVTTFKPDTPVIMLDVGGAHLSELLRLRELVFRPPIERKVEWPYVPHATVMDDAADDVIDAAVAALSNYREVIEFDGVHLLRQFEDRVWRPILQAPFGPRVVVHRAGVELQITVAEMLDALAAQRIGLADPNENFAVEALLDETVVAATWGRVSGDVLDIDGVWVDEDHRGLGFGAEVMRQACDAARLRNSTEIKIAEPLATDEVGGFFIRMGFAVAPDGSLRRYS